MGQKGGGFERDTCRLLSEWWTDGRDDSLFWRSSGSGARATTRRKKGKTTAGHCGDIAATDPAGYPLTQTFIIELKRGYPKANPLHLIAKSERAKPGVPEFQQFVIQAEAAALNACTPFWMIIHKWDFRTTMVYVPGYCPVEFLPWLRLSDGIVVILDGGSKSFYGTTLCRFLAEVDPQDVIKFHKEHYRDRVRNSGEGGRGVRGQGEQAGKRPVRE